MHLTFYKTIGKIYFTYYIIKTFSNQYFSHHEELERYHFKNKELLIFEIFYHAEKLSHIRKI